MNAVGLSGPGVAAWRDRVPAGAATPWCHGGRLDLGTNGRGVRGGRERDARRGRRGAGGERELSQPGESTRDLRPLASARPPRSSRRRASAGLPLWVEAQSEHARTARGRRAPRSTPAPTALVLVNTVLGLVIDIEARRPAARQRRRRREWTGHLAGRAALRLRVLAQRSRRRRSWVWGACAAGEDAVAMVMAGANAVEVGTATFADPRAPWMRRSVSSTGGWRATRRARVDRTDWSGSWLRRSAYGCGERLSRAGPAVRRRRPESRAARVLGAQPTRWRD